MILQFMRDVRGGREESKLSTCRHSQEDTGNGPCVDEFSTAAPRLLPHTHQLLLPFEDEQLAVVRFPSTAERSTERRKNSLWREGKIIYAQFGGSDECA